MWKRLQRSGDGAPLARDSDSGTPLGPRIISMAREGGLVVRGDNDAEQCLHASGLLYSHGWYPPQRPVWGAALVCALTE